MALDLPSGATVESVLGQLGIPDSKQPFVTCQGRVLKLTDQAPIGGTLHIFQPVAGG
ncbi:MAG: molybdopterin converting factor subunit 1 [Desulfobacteraceae bacterium]|nr:molybdopterin converting factor subunit 1 [Desulfobacteraceae bacterium]